MIRGWCPTVHAPMPSGDGLLVRVKPFGGRLQAAALAALAEAVAAYGNGVVQLTSRGNLQIRGVHDVPAFARAMVAAGLADPDPAREARRNVIAVPPCDDALVAEVEAVLAETPGLPAKFCVTIQRTTIFIAGTPVTDLPGALERACSPLTQPSPQGRGLLSSLPPLEGGGRGEVWGKHTLPYEQHHLLHLQNNQTTAQTLAHLATLLFRFAEKPSVGWVSEAPSTRGAAEVADGAALIRPTPKNHVQGTASLAAGIRTTPWRAFLSPVPAPGFLTEPGIITACIGAPGCRSATTRTQTDAATLQQAGHRHIHVSGCAKGCAYAHATTTLVGRDGRYDLVRHGRASDPADLCSLTLAEAMAAL